MNALPPIQPEGPDPIARWVEVLRYNSQNKLTEEEIRKRAGDAIQADKDERINGLLIQRALVDMAISVACERVLSVDREIATESNDALTAEWQINRILEEPDNPQKEDRIVVLSSEIAARGQHIYELAENKAEWDDYIGRLSEQIKRLDKELGWGAEVELEVELPEEWRRAQRRCCCVRAVQKAWNWFLSQNCCCCRKA